MDVLVGVDNFSEFASRLNLHQTALGCGDISLLRPDAAVWLGPGGNARYEHERNGKT
jgi:hypothetical protein